MPSGQWWKEEVAFGGGARPFHPLQFVCQKLALVVARSDNLAVGEVPRVSWGRRVALHDISQIPLSTGPTKVIGATTVGLKTTETGPKMGLPSEMRRRLCAM
eukprot:COSAG01_NODE_378_length_17882_cov_62.690344_2_plen_102_part_00